MRLLNPNRLHWFHLTSHLSVPTRKNCFKLHLLAKNHGHSNLYFGQGKGLANAVPVSNRDKKRIFGV